MNYFKLMQTKKPYAVQNNNLPTYLQNKAGKLCFQFNQLNPNRRKKQKKILQKLFGNFNKLVFIKPTFHCDYGFNIHFHGFCVMNYNCSILDTSPVNIGNGVFIAPETCLACSSHAINPKQRTSGIGQSAPITIENNVWLGAHCTVLAGVNIGKNSVIGANSLVNKNIPENVIAVGSPCKVLRKITNQDKIKLTL